MNELEYMNQMQMTAYGNTEIFTYIGVFSIVLQLVIHLLTSWGLWKINKKLGEPHAWLAWIPLINIYSFVRASGYSNIWILWLVLGMIAIIIPIIGILIFLFILIKILHGISKRCGKGVGTTIGLLFIPFIMFPLLAHKCEIKKDNNKEPNKEEKKVEL